MKRMYQIELSEQASEFFDAWCRRAGETPSSCIEHLLGRLVDTVATYDSSADVRRSAGALRNSIDSARRPPGRGGRRRE